MTKDNLWIFAIAIAFAIGVAVMLKLNGGKLPSGGSKSHTTESTVESIEDSEIEIIAEKVRNNPVLTDDFTEILNVANYMTVEKVIRTMTENKDGSMNTQYNSYLLSELDLINYTETTTDYSDASVGDGFEIEKARETDFETEFGFDYQKMNGKEIYEKLLQMSGIDGDLNKVTFDTAAYDMTGQEVYILDKECSVIKNLLDNTGYDELIGSEVSYQIAKIADGVNVPDYFTAVVQYKVNEQVVTKNLYLQITMNNGN